MTRRKHKNSESGQVIVEFVLVFAMIFGLIFLFVNMSWGIAWGHYVHYSTFMSSRAYMAAGLTQGDQYEAAGAVLKSTVKIGGKDIFPFLAPARPGGERDATGPEPTPGAMVGTHPEAIGKENSRLFSWAEGVQYNFGLKMFLLPISVFVGDKGTSSTIRPGEGGMEGQPITFKGLIPMTSDSFLGRERSVSECFEDMVKLSTTTGINRGDNDIFVEDNGC
ncbi:MAG TPA: hypothetical protein VIH99_01085 [Bdellovibrionota bacterium]|jgi:hypothetical protein